MKANTQTWGVKVSQATGQAFTDALKEHGLSKAEGRHSLLTWVRDNLDDLAEELATTDYIPPDGPRWHFSVVADSRLIASLDRLIILVEHSHRESGMKSVIMDTLLTWWVERVASAMPVPLATHGPSPLQEILPILETIESHPVMVLSTDDARRLEAMTAAEAEVSDLDKLKDEGAILDQVSDMANQRDTLKRHGDQLQALHERVFDLEERLPDTPISGAEISAHYVDGFRDQVEARLKALELKMEASLASGRQAYADVRADARTVNYRLEALEAFLHPEVPEDIADGMVGAIPMEQLSRLWGVAHRVEGRLEAISVRTIATHNKVHDLECGHRQLIDRILAIEARVDPVDPDVFRERLEVRMDNIRDLLSARLKALEDTVAVITMAMEEAKRPAGASIHVSGRPMAYRDNGRFTPAQAPEVIEMEVTP